MIPINSVIFEGVVSTDIEVTSADEGVFTVTHHRYYKVGEQNEVEETSVNVIVRGEQFAHATSIKGIKGKGIRVVGRLYDYEDGLSLFSEHMEFKPGSVNSGKYTFKFD
jgi:single-stranded DNA-binding protein